MRLDEKARENSEAADLLLLAQDASGLPEPLNNAAASRAYYAAYLAVADSALRGGRRFDSEQGYFRHNTLPDCALGWRLIDTDQRDDLEWLQGLRVKADYYEDRVDLEEASQAADVARGFLRLLEDRQ